MIKNNKEIISDKALNCLFLIYISPIILITGLTGLLRGKAILRYITIEGPWGIAIDIVYIMASVCILMMFIYYVVRVMRHIEKKNIKIILFILFNILYYGVCIIYVIDEYYYRIIINDLFKSIIIWILLIIFGLLFYTTIIYYISKLIKIIE